VPNGEPYTAYVAGWATTLVRRNCELPYPPLPAQPITTYQAIPTEEAAEWLEGEFSMPEFVFIRDLDTGQSRRYRFQFIDWRSLRWGGFYIEDPI
jgi:hypothetical protein